MKILIINTLDIYGGAAIAAFRLHEALLQNGVDSTMLVREKKSDVNTIITLQNKNLREKIIGKLSKIIGITLEGLFLIKYRKTITKNFGSFSQQIVSNRNLVKTINAINPDIVHLHWICYGFLSIEDIAKIKSPIVWSLHDMWAFTGGCHVVAEQVPQHSDKGMSRCCYDIDKMCNKYVENCGNCGVLRSVKKKDLSFRILQRKKRVFARIKSMTIVGVSKWMTDCAKKSAVFSNRRVVCLPNPINTNVFKQMDKIQARKLWNLPIGKKLILFGAVSATSTPYKGYDLLIEALNKISSPDIEFVVFGSSEPKDSPKLPHKIYYLGHLNDAESLVALYSACDVMVHPSMREAFGQTASESLSCGTPVVAFGHSGLLDVIEHKENGYLAQPFDTSDLAKGIDWALNAENYDDLCKNAREKVLREFNYGVVAKKYIELYKEVLKE
ncbi:MAG: glycosyltransferase family 4 protein [Chitinispirillales bacterium]|jgi:glycosyltransferase involved in cell wall biosynthesis|nr:glycosyltransferase family 4 protein [Chitinispirillales bacterium]